MSAGHEDRETNGSFDTSGRDRVTLSAQERQKLAHLEERIRLHDPDFASRMGGRSWRWLRGVASEVRFPTIPAWLGPVLVVVGLVTTLLIVGVIAWLSVLTLGCTVLGAQRVALSLRARLADSQSHQPDDPKL